MDRKAMMWFLAIGSGDGLHAGVVECDYCGEKLPIETTRRVSLDLLVGYVQDHMKKCRKH